MIAKVPLLTAVVSLPEERTQKTTPNSKCKPCAKHGEVGDAPLHECFLTAEICCEEARAAAKLKRFDSALGLFATAQSLLENAMQSGEQWRAEAHERLQSVSYEKAAYRELARSVARPLRKIKKRL